MSKYGSILGGGSSPLGSVIVGVGGGGPDGKQLVWMHHICEGDKTICNGDHKVCLDPYLGALSGTYVWRWR